MNSNNNTLNKFGIEYPYIASAMNSMLKSTNNGIKNISISESNGIIIDANWWCAVSAIAFFVTWGAAIFFAPESGSLSLYLGYMITMDFLGGVAEISALHSCFGGW